MASLCGNLNRPLSAMAAVVVASMSTDIPDLFNPVKTLDKNVSTSDKSTPIPVPIPNSEPNVNVICSSMPNLSNFKNHYKTDMGFSSYTSFSDSLIAPYQYAKLGKTCMNREISKPKFSDSDVLYRWHLPDPNKCSNVKSKTVVVLLGWLGAKQRHLRRYADWYTSRGYHVVTFTLPMSDIVSYKAADMTEENMGLLAKHLMDCLDEEDEKHLVFHTFSNTGWLMYGAILEKFREEDTTVMEKIKGCIVDSAPVDTPDPRVWASGFSAAFLKKQSVASKGVQKLDSTDEARPAITETVLLLVLEKFFGVVLNLPSINRRLQDVLSQLSSEQPNCPQLYIYSSADRVIPAKSVETFIERQRKAGYEVRSCDFVNSPHVDHYRNHPSLYTSQLTTFLEDCLPTETSNK